MNDNSKEAYNNIKPRISLHSQMIMSQLPELKTVRRERYPWYATKSALLSHVDWINGATCEEIAKQCQMTELQVVRRMSELERVGFVKRSEHKQPYTGSDGKTYHKQIWMAVNNEI